MNIFQIEESCINLQVSAGQNVSNEYLLSISPKWKQIRKTSDQIINEYHNFDHIPWHMFGHFPWLGALVQLVVATPMGGTKIISSTTHTWVCLIPHDKETTWAQNAVLLN